MLCWLCNRWCWLLLLLLLFKNNRVYLLYSLCLRDIFRGDIATIWILSYLAADFRLLLASLFLNPLTPRIRLFQNRLFLNARGLRVSLLVNLLRLLLLLLFNAGSIFVCSFSATFKQDLLECCDVEVATVFLDIVEHNDEFCVP